MLETHTFDGSRHNIIAILSRYNRDNEDRTTSRQIDRDMCSVGITDRQTEREIVLWSATFYVDHGTLNIKI